MIEERYRTEDGLSGMVVPVGEFDPASVKNRFTDISYGKLPEQKLDLYLPENGSGPFPLLMYIHGGGWMIGNKRLCFIDCIIDALRFGYAVASINYRLLPEGRYPEFLYDAKTALRWVRCRGEGYGIAPERVALVGDSAGGTIALLAAFTQGRPDFEDESYGWPGPAAPVKAVCAMYAPSVLDADEDRWFRESGALCRRAFKPSGEPEGGLYENAFGTAESERLCALSPISLVHGDIPPVLIQHGRNDSIVPYQHSLSLARRIAEVCGEERALLKLYPDRDHGDQQFLGPENCGEVLSFLAQHMQ